MSKLDIHAISWLGLVNRCYTSHSTVWSSLHDPSVDLKLIHDKENTYGNHALFFPDVLRCGTLLRWNAYHIHNYLSAILLDMV
jgi:hypothetical protein